MTPRYPDIRVSLTGQDGNAFAIMGRVAKALRRHGIDGAEIDQFLSECRSGDVHAVGRYRVVVNASTD